MNLILTGALIIAVFWVLALYSENKEKQLRINSLRMECDQNDQLYNKLNSSYIELYELYRQMKAEMQETLNNIRDGKN